tara:strand:- start:130 stop:1356 length:1227 start_codon:yes stop_codon:yes gene_type:complete
MYRFKQNDIIKNTVIAYPQYKFTLYNDSVYINNQTNTGVYTSGSLWVNDLNLPITSSHIIYTNLSKASKIGGNKIYNVDNYPVSGAAAFSFSITREFIAKSSAGGYEPIYTTGYGSPPTSSIAKFIALRNSIDEREIDSPVYKFSEYFTDTLSLGGADGSINGNLLQNINMLSVDNIFYGSSIKPGSVSLEFYQTGTLCAKAQDTKKNGVLIEQDNTNIGSGTTVGFILYEEGVFILTNTDSLGAYKEYFVQPTASALDVPALLDNPRWTNFGSYQNISGSTVTGMSGSTYVVDFKGVTAQPALTLFAYAPKNKLNWSNNPTYLDSSTKPYYINESGSTYYKENEATLVKNVVSSSFSNYSSTFAATTYIRTIGVYDEDKNLIAVAKVANPVKKTAEQDYTFKLKLDL